MNRAGRWLIVACLLVPFSVRAFTPAGEESQEGVTPDPRYSVFGPPLPAVYEFQLSLMNQGAERISSFNFYRKDQRNKTLFFKISDNDLNNRSEFRVQEVTGGAILFPFNDDDRFQFDVGGTLDQIKGTSNAEKTLFSRITVRPQASLWFRVGYELFDGYAPGNSATPFRGTSMASVYLAARMVQGPLTILGVVGRSDVAGVRHVRFGGAGVVEGPVNVFAMGGYIQSDFPEESVRTLAIGRWAPFRPDGIPSAFFIWKHRNQYDFQLGGLFYGRTNFFVRPAALGMSQGMFISSLALRENSELRQGQLMTITDDYRNADFTFFYVYMNQAIVMSPGMVNHVAVRAFQFFKIFGQMGALIFSAPVIGLFYNEETAPVYSPPIRKFLDKKTTYWSFQIGATIQDMFILNTIWGVDQSRWALALSYLYR
jgi:hypothetical protein